MPIVDSGGESAFGATIKEGRWPSPEIFDPVATAYEQQAATLRTAGNTSWAVHRPRLAQALQGQAGDAQIRAHDANIDLWDAHADLYERSASAVRNAAAELRSLQNDLRLLIEDKEPQYNSAIRRNEPVVAQGVLTATLSEADGMVATRGDAAAKYVHGVNFTAPPPQAPANPNGQGNQDHKDDTPHHDKQTDPNADGKKDGKKLPAGATGSDQTPRRDVQSDLPPDLPSEATAAGGPPRDVQTDLPPDALANGSQPLPVSGAGRMPSLSPTQMGAGGGGGGGGSGMSGLGSGLKPPSGLASSMPTSPASSMPSAPSMPASSSAASPMSNAGSSFQSGLASGMSATGGGNALSNLASPVSQQSVTQQGLPAQQVGGAPAFGSGSAGVPLSGPGSDAGLGSSSGSSSGGGAAPGGGGTPLMPPAAMGGAAPLAPYSAPGAGAGGAPAGGGSGTAPAASSGQSATAGAAAPGPVVAGGSGATVSAPGVAAMTNEVNPDLLLAQRVLGGLVRGCEDWPAPIAWAVGVVKTAVGSQVVIASSLGGGGYVPSTVFVPVTARLAVADPALPFGLAHKWMGCQKPSKILVDHFEQLSRRVAGAELSAMVTTELWPQEPAGVTDFLGVQHRQAMGMVSVAPTLDGAHQHRLTALDPGLAQRVSSIDSIGCDVSAYAAAQLTAAVIQAAGQPDDTGKPLATVREGNILASVQRGTANDMSWKLYDDLLRDEYGNDHESPDSQAPLDHDGSELTQALTLWYRHFFRLGRVIELVRLWKGGTVPPLAEIAYCGVQAGFGSVVAATISAIENEIRGRRGGTPS